MCNRIDSSMLSCRGAIGCFAQRVVVQGVEMLDVHLMRERMALETVASDSGGSIGLEVILVFKDRNSRFIARLTLE